MSSKEESFNKTACIKALKKHPEWLTEEDLLALLPLRDQREEVASLLERQAILLRQKNKELNETLKSFYDEAKNNSELLAGLKGISVGLLKVDHFSQLVEAVPAIFEKDFRIDKAFVSIPGVQALPDEVELPQDALSGFYLGKTEPEWNQYLFKDKQISSVAILALQADRDLLGYLFLGSHHETTFMASLSTDFLDWAGTLLSEKIDILKRREAG